MEGGRREKINKLYESRKKDRGKRREGKKEEDGGMKASKQIRKSKNRKHKDCPLPHAFYSHL